MEEEFEGESSSSRCSGSSSNAMYFQENYNREFAGQTEVDADCIRRYLNHPTVINFYDELLEFASRSEAPSGVKMNYFTKHLLPTIHIKSGMRQEIWKLMTSRRGKRGKSGSASKTKGGSGVGRSKRDEANGYKRGSYRGKGGGGKGYGKSGGKKNKTMLSKLGSKEGSVDRSERVKKDFLNLFVEKQVTEPEKSVGISQFKSEVGIITETRGKKRENEETVPLEKKVKMKLRKRKES